MKRVSVFVAVLTASAAALVPHGASADSYTLTCNPNGGILNGDNFGSKDGTTGIAAVTVVYGQPYYWHLGTATYAGHAFKGWFTAASGGVQVYDASGDALAGTYWSANGYSNWQYNGDLTVYAQWENGADSGTKPDLRFWKNKGWPSSLYLSNVLTDEATHEGTSVAEFEIGETVYLDLGYTDINDSGATAELAIGFSLNNNDTGGTMSQWEWTGWGIPSPKGLSFRLNYQLAMLQGLPAGSYTLRVTLDSTGVIDETDEANNTAEFAFKVVAGNAMFTIDENGCLTAVDPRGGTSITVPLRVRSIAAHAFSNCGDVTSITIPNSVTNISEGAFSGCGGLEEITLPFVGARCGNPDGRESLFGWIFGTSSYTGGTTAYQEYRYYIGDHSYNSTYCPYIPSSLSKVEVTDETSFGYGAFCGCHNLTNVMIPNSVTSIGDYAFKYCGLTNVTIPGSVKSIGRWAFYGCCAYYTGGSGLTNATIGDGVTDIGYGAFCSCDGLTNVTIPDSVTYIGGYAFNGCSGLAEVTIPNSVTNIGYGAFSSCDRLTNVTIPDSVTYIGGYAFTGCSGLADVTIPDSVTYIGEYAFNGCSGLAEVTIPNSVTNIGEYAFNGCGGLTNVTVSQAVCTRGIGNCFAGSVDSISRITLSAGVREKFSVGAGFTALTMIEVAEGNRAYTSVGGILYDREKTRLVRCPPRFGTVIVDVFPGTADICDEAFAGCVGLEAVTIPGGVTNIGAHAFSGCTAMLGIALPESVKTVGNGAFYECTALSSMTVPFVGHTRNAEQYEAKFRWFFNDDIPDSLVSVVVTDHDHVPASAFEGCRSIRSISYPNGLDNIGHRAFKDCTSLKSATVPDGVTYLGDSVFSGCTSLKSAYVGAGVTALGEDMFAECTALESVRLGDSVEKIGARAFSGCRALTSIVFPATLLSVGARAFEGCTSLRKVYYTGSSAPYAEDNIYAGTDNALFSFVPENSIGWDIGSTSVLPRYWPVDDSERGRRIAYGVPPAPAVQTVTFNPNGGNVSPATRVVENGMLAGELPTPTRSDYTFDGWFSEDGIQVFSTSIVTGDVTYYAHWTRGAATEPEQPQGPASGPEPAPVPVPDPISVEKAFGPGHGSRFAVSDSETALVVGVYGLKWSDFSIRASDGLHVFADSRIVDREKGSGADAIDHQWCETYAKSVLCVWTGWSQYIGFTDEDALSEWLLEQEEQDVIGFAQARATAYGKDMAAHIGTITPDAAFPQTLASAFENADRLVGAQIYIDDYEWYGTHGDWGHWVVCCGYSLDSAKPLSDPACLKGLFIIDSDNDRETAGGGSNAPDTITYCPVTWDSTANRYWIDHIFGTTGYFEPDCMTLRAVSPATAEWSDSHEMPGADEAPQPADGTGGGTTDGDATDGGGNGGNSGGNDVGGGTGGGESGTGGGGTAGGGETGDGENTVQDTTTEVVVNGPVYAGTISSNYAKAQMSNGTLYKGGALAGTIQVKVGKADKKGYVKISGTATLLVDGKAKKVTAKGVKVDMAATSAAAPVKVAFKAPIGELELVVLDNGKFTLKNGTYEMVEASVGGDWTRAGARVWVSAGGGRGATALPAGTVEELLPDGEPVAPKGGKWSFAKATSVKWAKPTKDAALPENYDAASGKGLLVDESNGRTNRSAMKLTYTPNTGIFKGSFKIYAVQGGKLKKFTVRVIGVVVDGKGQGSATGPGGAGFAVTVE